MSREMRKIYDLRDKEFVIRCLVEEMERRCQTIFKWNGLPETIDARWLELILQRTGNVTFTKIDDSDIKQYPDSRNIEGGYYVFGGSPGGVEDFNGLATFSIIAHPRLLKSMTKIIGEDCVVIYDDSQHEGLWNLHLRWATQIAEALLTLQIGNVSSRAMTIGTVGTDTEKLAFEQFMKNLEDGKLSALVGNLVMDSIKTLDYASTAHQMLTDVIEEVQYLRASWARELGMDENFNLKREAIMAAEASLGEDAIMTLLEDMLLERRKACEEINRIFGLNVSVDFSRIFENNIMEEEAIENVDGDENTDGVTDDSSDAESGTDGDNSDADGDSVEQTEEQMTEETTEEVQEENQEDVTEDNSEEEKEAEVVININIDSAEEVVVEDAQKEELEETETDEEPEQEETEEEEDDEEDEAEDEVRE